MGSMELWWEPQVLRGASFPTLRLRLLFQVSTRWPCAASDRDRMTPSPQLHPSAARDNLTWEVYYCKYAMNYVRTQWPHKLGSDVTLQAVANAYHNK